MKIKNCDLKYIGTNFSHYPQDGLPEIAFAGKSNVGKSSVINRILQRKNFARVGEKPGKTIHVNYFVIDRKAYLVDLPGYGFAKVSEKEKQKWAVLMEDFFKYSEIAHVLSLVDIRLLFHILFLYFLFD